MSPRTPLLNPHEYFADRDDPFPTGLLVFVLHVAVDILLLFVLVHLLFSRIENPPKGLQGELTNMLVGVLPVGLLLYGLAWLIVAAMMHGFIGGSSTDGSFRDALGVAGWAYAPELITAPATLGFTWYQLSQLHLDGSDTAQLAAELEAIESATFHPVSLAILLLVTGWSLCMLARGIAATHNVSVSETLFPALLIGVGSFLLALI
ncbi:YIP1 family protein [Natronobeatus ordinarius]|uniref:YIP1 family protein n=1 Tax=Natronobeatus ordinarius TaxID=2963433 RepID=UPI0020CDCFDA|nr:YIP1 family protein [Natronobeatus ordinarius]